MVQDPLALVASAATMAFLSLAVLTRAWELTGAGTRPFYTAAVFSVLCDAPVWWAAHVVGWSAYIQLIRVAPLDPAMWFLAIASGYAAIHPLVLLGLFIRHRLLRRRMFQYQY